ncbi:MAG TPA: ATP-binding protein, partial [Lachnospiraceae bacterium]|nr:ATP-binding protein [Lachnospiraceae bacterium]
PEIEHPVIANHMVKAIETKEDSEKSHKLLQEYRVNVIILDTSGKKYTLGKEKLQYQDALFQAAQLIREPEGYVSINYEEAYILQVTTKENSYKVCILYNVETAGYDSKYYNALDQQYIIVIVSTFIGILIAVILAIHFLSRSVFRKINDSLKLFVDGVHQINEGNLDYRIVYNAKDEFAPVCNDFNLMAARLSESIELTNKQEQNRKELIAGISHDLRSPLTSIKAYVEGLIDGVATTPQSQRSYMQMIKTKAEEIDHMVSKLFLFSKMDMGDYPYAPELLSISQEIESYVEATSNEYQEKGLTIHMNKLEPDVLIYADPLQLRSVLANILENSSKYKDKPVGESWISINRKGNQVCIIIEDDGPGVGQEELGKLFQVFYRSDRSRSNPNRGSGLGLAITAKAINYMGGNIYAMIREPNGLRIIIELSIAKDTGMQDELIQDSRMQRGGEL